MLRLAGPGYQANVRSASLLKVKERHDAEVTVLGATPSREGWAILRVKADWGPEFDISAPGSVPEKTEVLENIENYVGRRLTIEYAHLTSDQIPFHAVATRWREDV
jgi:ATP-dependent DNA ligase